MVHGTCGLLVLVLLILGLSPPKSNQTNDTAALKRKPDVFI
jgi:hypothetical protein